jgi:hypothetical protein
MDLREIQSEIQRILEEICTTGDPWELSDLGIEAYIRRMDATYEALIFCTDRVKSQKLRKLILKVVYEMVQVISETIEYRHNVKKAPTKQAYIARAGRNRKVAKRHKDLISFIEVEAKSLNLALSKGLKFAQLIRPGVRTRLGLEPDGDGWPSPSTIKGVVTELKARQKAVQKR